LAREGCALDVVSDNEPPDFSSSQLTVDSQQIADHIGLNRTDYDAGKKRWSK
jgi:hypothetical protein